MPVIVIGADTALGVLVVERLAASDREVRAFVSSPEVGERLRQLGIKVALGDLSDQSHVAAACTNCFSVVLITEAATDDRELSFAKSPDQVWAGWAAAIRESRAKRAIWVGNGTYPVSGAPEEAAVAATMPVDEIAEKVAALDDAAAI
jgi:uncharacterized protein YbjT (DUF2867 family)